MTLAVIRKKRLVPIHATTFRNQMVEISSRIISEMRLFELDVGFIKEEHTNTQLSIDITIVSNLRKQYLPK